MKFQNHKISKFVIVLSVLRFTDSDYPFDISNLVLHYLGTVNFNLRNNSTVFEDLEVSVVDLTIANAVLLDLTPTTLQIQYCYSYSDEILPACTH